MSLLHRGLRVARPARARHDGGNRRHDPGRSGRLCGEPRSEPTGASTSATRRCAESAPCRAGRSATSSSNQVALFTVLALADPGRSGVAYTYAFVFFQLPHGLFAVSIMTTFAPDLAAWRDRRISVAFRERFTLGLRLIALVDRALVGRTHIPGPTVDRRCSNDGRFTRGVGSPDRQRADRVPVRPRRLLALPLLITRVLRTQGHPHAVPAEPRSRTRSSRRWRSPS